MSESIKDVLIDYFRAQEAAAVDAQRRLGANVAQKKKEPDPSKLSWELKPKEGDREAYERCGITNLEGEPLVAYQELRTWIGDTPKWLRGTLFWVQENGNAIGRRKKA
jgi:hypothetical protein